MTGLEGKSRDLGTTGSKLSLFHTAWLSQRGFAAALLWLPLERALTAGLYRFWADFKLFWYED